MFNRIVLTADRYTAEDMTGSIMVKMEGTFKEYQRVVSVGTTVRDFKEGDLVLIDPSRYAIKKHQSGSLKDGIITDNPVIKYNFPMLEMNDTEYLLLSDSDIVYIIEDYEEEKPKKANIIMPKKQIIL